MIKRWEISVLRQVKVAKTIALCITGLSIVCNNILNTRQNLQELKYRK